MLLLVLLLLLVGESQGSHFRGAMMTYYPKETYTNGSVSVIIRQRFNYQSCGDGYFACYGNCGVESLILPNTKIDEVSGSWCLSEKITSRLLPNNSALQLVFDNFGWFSNLNGIYSWRVVTDVELRHRSDTNKPNSSPQTTIFSALRVPSNCGKNIYLLAFDPDGDVVQCRYANLPLAECKTPCTPPPVFSLSTGCVLSFSGTSSSNEGWYVIQMVMQDFPRQTITLTQTNGDQVVRSTGDAISKIPLQFPFQVDPAAPSCTHGIYIPKFLSPTPNNGAQLSIQATEALQINILAEATEATIFSLLFSGPPSVVKTSLGSGSFTLTWTPPESEEGQGQPICFVVEAISINAVYQSELRCVVVRVLKTPKVTYARALRMKISSLMSLTDNRNVIEDLIKEDLIRRGFPTGITVRLRSSRTVEAL